jgi:hypothetical protein
MPVSRLRVLCLLVMHMFYLACFSNSCVSTLWKSLLKKVPFLIIHAIRSIFKFSHCWHRDTCPIKQISMLCIFFRFSINQFLPENTNCVFILECPARAQTVIISLAQHTKCNVSLASNNIIFRTVSQEAFSVNYNMYVLQALCNDENILIHVVFVYYRVTCDLVRYLEALVRTNITSKTFHHSDSNKALVLLFASLVSST